MSGRLTASQREQRDRERAAREAEAIARIVAAAPPATEWQIALVRRVMAPAAADRAA
jgi:hypothetical protein